MAKGQGRCCRDIAIATCAQMRVPKPSVRPSCAGSFPPRPVSLTHSVKAFPFKAIEMWRLCSGDGTIIAEL